MKLAVATAFLAGTAAAFTAPAFSRPSSFSAAALKMTATETETYTFSKSEEIFAEAQTVRPPSSFVDPFRIHFSLFHRSIGTGMICFSILLLRRFHMYTCDDIWGGG